MRYKPTERWHNTLQIIFSLPFIIVVMLRLWLFVNYYKAGACLLSLQCKVCVSLLHLGFHQGILESTQCQLQIIVCLYEEKTRNRILLQQSYKCILRAFLLYDLRLRIMDDVSYYFWWTNLLVVFIFYFGSIFVYALHLYWGLGLEKSTWYGRTFVLWSAS